MNKHPSIGIIAFAVLIMIFAFIIGMPNHPGAAVATMADKSQGDVLGAAEYNTIKDALVDGTRAINTLYMTAAGMKSATGTITSFSTTYGVAGGIEATTGVITTGTVTTLGSTTATLTNGVVSGSLKIPNGTAPTVDATGEMALDTTDNSLIIYDGTASRVYSDGHYQVNFCIASITDSMEIPIMFCPHEQAITIERIVAGCVGGGTSTIGFEAREYATLGTAGSLIMEATPFDTVGKHITTLDNFSMAADQVLFATTASSTGTLNFFAGTIFYRKNVE